MPLPARTIFLFLVLSVASVYPQQYGWVRVAQLGNEFAHLKTVEFVDSMHGWLYGFQVNYMYTLDGGLSWMQAISDGGAATSISMLDTVLGWAAGNGVDAGSIRKTTDGGRSWIQQRLFLDRAYVGTSALSIQKDVTSGYKRTSGVRDTGKVVQTSNGGTTWTERTIADSIVQLGKIQFVDSLYGWIVANIIGNIIRTTDGGVTWSSIIATPSIEVISFVSRSLGYGVTPSANCFMTTDGGLTWTQLGRLGLPGSDLSPTDMSFADSTYGWACGFLFYHGANRGAIFGTTDGGVTWNAEHIGTGVDEKINDMIMLDRYHGWAVGTGGQVLAYRVVSSVPERLPGVPKGYALKQNYPNPFNPTTSIDYAVADRSPVSIKVYDVSGREVKELVNSLHEPGVYRLRFDGTGLASGVYYYTLNAGQYSEAKQMTLLK